MELGDLIFKAKRKSVHGRNSQVNGRSGIKRHLETFVVVVDFTTVDHIDKDDSSSALLSCTSPVIIVAMSSVIASGLGIPQWNKQLRLLFRLGCETPNRLVAAVANITVTSVVIAS